MGPRTLRPDSRGVCRHPEMSVSRAVVHSACGGSRSPVSPACLAREERPGLCRVAAVIAASAGAGVGASTRRCVVVRSAAQGVGDESAASLSCILFHGPSIEDQEARLWPPKTLLMWKTDKPKASVADCGPHARKGAHGLRRRRGMANSIAIPDVDLRLACPLNVIVARLKVDGATQYGGATLRHQFSTIVTDESLSSFVAFLSPCRGVVAARRRCALGACAQRCAWRRARRMRVALATRALARRHAHAPARGPAPCRERRARRECRDRSPGDARASKAEAQQSAALAALHALAAAGDGDGEAPEKLGGRSCCAGSLGGCSVDIGRGAI